MSKTAVIDAIKVKIDRLIADNTTLRADHAKVVQQRDRARSENRELTEHIARLEKRVRVLELREGMTGGAMATSEDTKAARARVNRLMREVDKCIALLNK
jgi:polyhydroxyalkanoate synthesis regulator phasin